MKEEGLMIENSLNQEVDSKSPQVNNEPKKPGQLILIAIFCMTMCISIPTYANMGFPQLYEDILIKQFKITPIEIESLYSIYTLPNLIITPLGAYIVSVFGGSFGNLLCNSVILYGSAIIGAAFYFNSYPLLLLGRAFYGFGAEVAVVSQVTICEKWFSGKLLSISLAFNRTVASLGVIFVFYIGPELYLKSRSIHNSLTLYGYVNTFVCCVAAALCLTEYFYFKKHKEVNQPQQINSDGKESENKVEIEKPRGIKIKDIFKLNSLFWIVGFVFVIGSNIFLQFMSFSTDCLMNRYGFNFEEAKNLISLIPTLSICFLPLLSFIVLKMGKKGYLTIIAFIISAGTFFAMRSIPVNPPKSHIIAAIASFTFAYCLFLVSVWTSMPLSMPSSATVLGLGINVTMQNFVLTILAEVFGFINKNRSIAEYNNSFLTLIIISLISVVLAVISLVIDLKTGRRLDLPENHPEVTKIRKLADDRWKKDLKESKPKETNVNDEYKSFGEKKRLNHENKIE